MTEFYSKIYKNLKSRAADEEYQFVTVGILAAIGFPLFYIIWRNFPGESYENLFLRIIAMLLGLVLALKNYWPAKLKTSIYIYWYVFLLYIMPFFFTFMLLKNDASVTWQLNTLLAFILLMIVVNWLMFTILSVVGVTIAVALYFLTTPIPTFNNNFTVTIINILAMLVCCIFILRKKDKIQNERFEALKAFGATLAHELRTPLTAIQSGVEGIKAYLPGLISTYKVANDKQMATEHIRGDQLMSLERSVENVTTESNLANMTINMLLTNVRQSKLTSNEISVFTASDLVEEALLRYPMQTEQRDLIHVNSQHDFMIQGDRELLTHVLFNLLKNALYYIEAAQKGEITVWFEQQEKFNRIYFKDTGQGIAPDDLPHIFERFYTRTYHGSGIGLAFCKTAMQLHKGSITCQSTYGEYAEFIISFPKVTVESI